MQKLEQLRNEIAEIDAVLIEKLAQRQNLSRQIGRLKVELGKAVLDVSREAQLFQYYQKLSVDYELDPIFVQHLFELIFAHSRDLQQRGSLDGTSRKNSPHGA
jgi:chorismate mutase